MTWPRRRKCCTSPWAIIICPLRSMQPQPQSVVILALPMGVNSRRYVNHRRLVKSAWNSSSADILYWCCWGGSISTPCGSPSAQAQAQRLILFKIMIKWWYLLLTLTKLYLVSAWLTLTKWYSALLTLAQSDSDAQHRWLIKQYSALLILTEWYPALPKWYSALLTLLKWYLAMLTLAKWYSALLTLRQWQWYPAH